MTELQEEHQTEMEIKSFPKLRPQVDEAFREWIRRQRCCVCSTNGVEKADGIYRVECSHMLTRGAGRSDYNNCLPMCHQHHRAFEDCTSVERASWRAVAERYTTTYLEMKHGRQS